MRYKIRSEFDDNDNHSETPRKEFIDITHEDDYAVYDTIPEARSWFDDHRYEQVHRERSRRQNTDYHFKTSHLSENRIATLPSHAASEILFDDEHLEEIQQLRTKIRESKYNVARREKLAAKLLERAIEIFQSSCDSNGVVPAPFNSVAHIIDWALSNELSEKPPRRKKPKSHQRMSAQEVGFTHFRQHQFWKTYGLTTPRVLNTSISDAEAKTRTETFAIYPIHPALMGIFTDPRVTTEDERDILRNLLKLVPRIDENETRISDAANLRGKYVFIVHVLLDGATKFYNEFRDRYRTRRDADEVIAKELARIEPINRRMNEARLDGASDFEVERIASDGKLRVIPFDIRWIHRTVERFGTITDPVTRKQTLVVPSIPYLPPERGTDAKPRSDHAIWHRIPIQLLVAGLRAKEWHASPLEDALPLRIDVVDEKYLKLLYESPALVDSAANALVGDILDRGKDGIESPKKCFDRINVASSDLSACRKT